MVFNVLSKIGFSYGSKLSHKAKKMLWGMEVTTGIEKNVA